MKFNNYKYALLVTFLFAVQKLFAQQNFIDGLKKEMSDDTKGNWVGFLGCASKSNTDSYDEYILIEFKNTKRSECVKVTLDRAKKNNSSEYTCGPSEKTFCLNLNEADNELFVKMLTKNIKNENTVYIHFVDTNNRNNALLPSPGLKKKLGSELKNYCKDKATNLTKTNKNIKAECIYLIK